MALVACADCRQPFYASCHDGNCLDALCPYCEYDAERSNDTVPIDDEVDETPSASVAALSGLAEAAR